MDSPNSTSIVGWQADGGGRGTWTLLWTFLTTIFLAVSIACHPPAGHKPSNGTRFGIKLTPYHFWRFFLAIYGLTLPEMLVGVALGELVEAHNVREEIRRQTCPAFTLQEAFFICMGGYRLRIPARDGPLEVSESLREGQRDQVLHHKQVVWLVKAGIIGMPQEEYTKAKHTATASIPSISIPVTTDIEDSSPNKGEIKVVDVPVTQSVSPQAFLLDSWTIDQRSGSDGLAKAIVIFQCTFFIINCIGRGANQLPLSLPEVLVLSYIVLTFATYAMWWHKPQNVQQSVVFDLVLTDLQGKELDEIVGNVTFIGPGGDAWAASTEMDPRLSRTMLIQFWSFILACWLSTGMHFAAWNYEFPSTTERTIWRVLAVILIGLPIFIVADSRIFGHGHGRLFPQKVNGWIQAFFVTIGVIAKIGLLILALMSLRAAPESIYETWEISNWLLFWL